MLASLTSRLEFALVEKVIFFPRINAVSFFSSSSGELPQAHEQRRSHDAKRTRKTVLSHVSRNNPHPTIFFPFQTGDRVRTKICLNNLFSFFHHYCPAEWDINFDIWSVFFFAFVFIVVAPLFTLQLQTYMVWIPADKSPSCSLPPVPPKIQGDRFPPSRNGQSRMRNFGQFAGLYQTTYHEEIAQTPFLRRSGTNECWLSLQK